MRVDVSDLACDRAGRRVFDGLALEVKEGEAAQLRGPNGVGKSTLLRVLAGLVPPASGRIVFGEDDVSHDPGLRQETVALTGHLDAMKPGLTLAENLAIWATLFDGDVARVGPALDRFGLASLADRPAGQCSAGQKRRAGLARLLVAERPIWLLDEPTVSLDTASAHLIAELVHTHCAEGGSALVATHIDLDLPAGPVLTMTPPKGDAPLEDAFLAGDWG